MKKYLNDATTLVWHMERAGSFVKKLQLYRENEDKDMFSKDAWINWLRKKLEESTADLYRDIEMKGPS